MHREFELTHLHSPTSRNTCQYLKHPPWDVPGGPVVRNPSCNAGDVGSVSGQGTKIPHAAERLSLNAATTCVYPGARAPQLESPCALTKDLTRHGEDHAPCSYDPTQPNKYIKKKVLFEGTLHLKVIFKSTSFKI